MCRIKNVYISVFFVLYLWPLIRFLMESESKTQPSNRGRGRGRGRGRKKVIHDGAVVLNEVYLDDINSIKKQQSDKIFKSL